MGESENFISTMKSMITANSIVLPNTPFKYYILIYLYIMCVYWIRAGPSLAGLGLVFSSTALNLKYPKIFVQARLGPRAFYKIKALLFRAFLGSGRVEYPHRSAKLAGLPSCPQRCLNNHQLSSPTSYQKNKRVKTEMFGGFLRTRWCHQAGPGSTWTVGSNQNPSYDQEGSKPP